MTRKETIEEIEELESLADEVFIANSEDSKDGVRAMARQALIGLIAEELREVASKSKSPEVVTLAGIVAQLAEQVFTKEK